LPRTVSVRRDDPSSEAGEKRGLQPRYRRAFGCVTWLYMAILAFLAAAFLLLLPFRYLGSGEIYKLLAGLSFLGLVLILPGMAFAAALGARTYRSQRGRGTRVGMGIGAIVGWLAFFALAWLTGLVDPSAASAGPAFYAFPPLALAALLQRRRLRAPPTPGSHRRGGRSGGGPGRVRGGLRVARRRRGARLDGSGGAGRLGRGRRVLPRRRGRHDPTRRRPPPTTRVANKRAPIVVGALVRRRSLISFLPWGHDRIEPLVEVPEVVGLRTSAPYLGSVPRLRTPRAA
jgi:hypothetical protein